MTVASPVVLSVGLGSTIYQDSKKLIRKGMKEPTSGLEARKSKPGKERSGEGKKGGL